MTLLERAGDRQEFLSFSPEEDEKLCQEIRSFLIDSVSKTGGHLASNLGAVELTVALHKVFDPFTDRIVFDVGHQSYVHKLLTGRMAGFDHLRQFGGMAGFPRPNESEADAFVGGHASNSVSAGLGIARARTLMGGHYSVVSVIGDGALTGGLAYEGLNDAGQSREPLIVVLNDNGMSIQPNVGGIAKFLARQRLKPSYFNCKRVFHAVTNTVPGGKAVYRVVHRVKNWMKNALIGSNMFDEMGFTYLGPVDGHDIPKLVYLLEQAKSLNCPVMLHVTTTKGRGYSYAEENPDEYHGVSAFDVQSGCSGGSSKETFSSAFGKTMCAMANEDWHICAVTAAMEQGTGLTQFAHDFPKHFFDVGIAEGHAVTMASGLAKQGMAITALAGPVSNFLLALIALGIGSLLLRFGPEGLTTAYALLFFCQLALVSVGLGLFNLIPVPPLDGSRLLSACLPDNAYRFVMRYERFLVVVVVLLAWSGALSGPLSAAVAGVMELLCRCTGFPFALVTYYFF